MEAVIACDEGFKTIMAVNKDQWQRRMLGDIPVEFEMWHERFHQVYGGQEHCKGAKFTYQDSI